MEYYLGIDVGTGSARAGIFDAKGDLLAVAKKDIALWRNGEDMVEQSSENIWQAVCYVAKSALQQSNIDKTQLKGIGFDATCSLVVLGEGGIPLPVSDSGDAQRNIIVWMDHRAVQEAEAINQGQYEVLKYVGGSISPEMQTPKLLWLKKNFPQTYQHAWQFMDLVDYLTWRATGSLTRSLCTLTCKWTYLAHEKRWDEHYFHAIGLSDLVTQNFSRIGQQAVSPGTALANGLLESVAEEWGILPGTPVASGLIDAHAGGLGTVGALDNVEQTLAYIFGTSSCTMTSTQHPVFIEGIWGPYYQAMLPHLWLNEGGQTAAGAAIDRLLALFPHHQQQKIAHTENKSLHQYLEEQAIKDAGGYSQSVTLANGLHIVPEFAGNRSPIPNPKAKAIIAGLGMSEIPLVNIYIAGLIGIGYGLRQILEAQEKQGITIKNIVISGGAGQSQLVRQLLADTTGKIILSPRSSEPVLLGAAILGALASQRYSHAQEAMREMSHIMGRCEPNQQFKATHEQRYQIFNVLQKSAHQLTLINGEVI